MKTNYLTLAAIVICILLAQSGNSQNKNLLGMVTAFDSIPLKGIQIQVNGEKESVFSDLKGNFRVPGNEEMKLVISGSGFYKQTIKIKPDTEELHINMMIKAGSKNTGRALAYLPTMTADELNQLLLAEEANKYAKYKSMEELVRKEFPGKLLANSNLSYNRVAFLVDDRFKDKNEFLALDPADIKEIYFTQLNFNSTLKDAPPAIVVITKSAKSDPDILVNGAEKYMSRKF
ncbi:hypothetical protein [Maribellus sediminis]|uniref:hypothetical protein n=1 Tax=Maribellus sediminis TaxID=2696285 RepID=UPI0014316AFF|nr:hypothetical protein [Maribellus sediminis]